MCATPETLEREIAAFFDDVFIVRDPTRPLANLVGGVGCGGDGSGSVSFLSEWSTSEPEYYMFKPGCLLYVAAPRSISDLPVAESVCKLIPLGDFCDQLEAFWKQAEVFWQRRYYPDEPGKRAGMEPLMAELRHNLGVDGQPEQDALGFDPNVFHIAINVAMAPIGQVPDDPDMTELVSYLAHAVRSGFGAPVKVTCWSDLRDDDPVTNLWVRWPAYVTMTMVCPSDEVPADERTQLQEQHRQFCDQVQAYLDGSYYQRHPDRKDQTEAAIEALCHALRLEPTGVSWGGANE